MVVAEETILDGFVDERVEPSEDTGDADKEGGRDSGTRKPMGVGLLRIHRLGESVEIVCVLIHSVWGRWDWGCR